MKHKNVRASGQPFKAKRFIEREMGDRKKMRVHDQRDQEYVTRSRFAESLGDWPEEKKEQFKRD